MTREARQHVVFVKLMDYTLTDWIFAFFFFLLNNIH